MNRQNYFAFLISQGFLPFCVLLGYLTGQEFTLHSEAFYLIVVTAVSIWLVHRIQKAEEGSRLGIPALILSLVHGLTLLLVVRWWAGGIAAVVGIVCGWILFEGSPKGWLKVLCRVFSLLLTMLFVPILPIWLFVAGMGANQVVQALDSPDGRYTAMVISSDQGALGGDTLVEVRDNQETVNILIGSFEDSQRVYHGEWYEWKDMEIVWEGDDVLLLNGTACSVDAEDIALITETAGELGIAIRNGVVLEYSDTHGGFHGDGLTVVKIQGNITSMDGEFWHDLPMSETAAKIPNYLGVDAVSPENGRWFFYDRHTESARRDDPAPTLSRASCNFTFAVWDAESRILYYYKIDT